MTVSTQHATVFDRSSSDGTLLQRGYLELSLDEQHCEGASAPDAHGNACLTLTLFVCDPADNRYREATVFQTRVRADAPIDTRRKLLARFMDRLTGTYVVNPFAQAGDLDETALESFRAEVEFATAAWVD